MEKKQIYLQPDTVLTACSDGRILCHDLRGGSSSESMLAGSLKQFAIVWLLSKQSILCLCTGCSHAFHAVHFNPVQPNLVATSNDKVSLRLRELRNVCKCIEFKVGVGLWDLRRPGCCLLQYGGVSSMLVMLK